MTRTEISIKAKEIRIKELRHEIARLKAQYRRLEKEQDMQRRGNADGGLVCAQGAAGN